VKVSVVVPVYNEEENIERLVGELHQTLSASYPDNFEVIFVDDGSHDRSLDRLLGLVKKIALFKVVKLRRNFGQTAAMMAGFTMARAEYVVPLDADLQNNPQDIPRMIAIAEEGYDIVSGWRKHRKDGFVLRLLPSMLANRLISRLTGVKLHDYGCTLKVYRASLIKKVQLYGEMHRFIPAIASQYGARITEVAVDHRPREAGDSKYGIDRTFRVVYDVMTVRFLMKYMKRPMQLFGKWAMYSFAAGFLAGATTLYMRFGQGLMINRNPLLILTAFLLFAGMNFIALGLLAELVTRAYYEGQNKPTYEVEQTYNL
jgi:glycosyltransferase involved in cell wall biosynthesis